MIRIFIMLIGLIIISALASGLADLPGRLRLIMAHYQVEVSLTLVAAIGVGDLVIGVDYMGIVAVFAIPACPNKPPDTCQPAAAG